MSQSKQLILNMVLVAVLSFAQVGTARAADSLDEINLEAQQLVATNSRVEVSFRQIYQHPYQWQAYGDHYEVGSNTALSAAGCRWTLTTTEKITERRKLIKESRATCIIDLSQVSVSKTTKFKLFEGGGYVWPVRMQSRGLRPVFKCTGYEWYVPSRNLSNENAFWFSMMGEQNSQDVVDRIRAAASLCQGGAKEDSEWR